jgi:cellulose synthase operon protein C
MTQRKMCLAALAAALLVANAGCGERSNADIMASARAYLVQDQPAAAAVELRTLLARKPNAGEARYLLGMILVDAGDLFAAEDQLRLALTHGYPEEEVVPQLTKVLNTMNRSFAIVKEFGDLEFKDRAASAALKVQVAAARLREGDVPGAAKDIDRALQLVADQPDALAWHARLAAMKGDVAAARSQIDAVLQRQPTNAAAWALLGDLLMMAERGQTVSAIGAHRTALKFRPAMVQSHAAIITMLIGIGDAANATVQWEALKKALPQHPQTAFFEAVLALHKGDAMRALDITRRMLTVSPTDLRLLVLAGQAALQVNAPEEAELQLSKAVTIAPKALLPRHLLAEAYIRTGRAESALVLLKPVVGSDRGDPMSLTLAGRALLTMGDAAAASSYFARAVALRPDDKQVRTATAVARLSTTDNAAALAELESLAREGDGGAAALSLISARIARKEFAQAKAAIDGYAAKLPNQALPDDLRGRIALAQGQRAEARKHFEAALTRQAAYFPALIGLTALDVADGQPAAAVERLEAARRRDPANAEVRLALARLLAQTQGDPARVSAVLEEAVAAQPTDARFRVALIDHLLRLGQLDAALAAAQKAEADKSDAIDLVDMLGRVYTARKESEQAIAVFNAMNLRWPRSALPHQRLAEVYLTLKRNDAAAEQAQLALRIAPRSLPAQQAAATAALRQKQPAKALAIARTVQTQRPADAAGFLLEGEIEAAMRNFSPAAVAFRKALDKAPSTEIAKRLHLALLGGGNTAEADRWAEQWRRKHPDDTSFVVHVADAAMVRGELDAAERLYREVLQRLPGNALAMNNVAYVMVKQGKPGAIAIAEEAARLAPRSPAVLDTLAEAFALDKQFAKAIEWQTKALALAPTTDSLRLNLARLHLKAGQREPALEHLDQLAARGKAFSGYAEVAQLRKQLGP